jgi:Zn-dependent oligopeptidase
LQSLEEKLADAEKEIQSLRAAEYVSADTSARNEISRLQQQLRKTETEMEVKTRDLRYEMEKMRKTNVELQYKLGGFDPKTQFSDNQVVLIRFAPAPIIA